MRSRSTTIARAVAGAAVLALACGAARPAEPAVDPGLARILALRAQRPGDGMLVFYEAMLRARTGDRDGALAALQSLVGRRLGLIPVPDTGFDALADDAGFRAVRDRLAADEAETRPPAPVAFTVADARLIPEGIAYDAATKRHFLGSIAQRKVVVVDATRATRDFSAPDDGLDAVLGLAVDAPRRRLVVVSTNAIDDAAKAGRRNALVVYDLASGRKLARHDVPEAAQLNDVAVAPDGTLYATDSAAGSVFRLRPGEAAPSLLGAAGSAPGANGIAVAPDGTLYVALSTGVGRVDAGGGALARMAQPDTVATGGIDGLYWHGGDLVGIQNVSNPGRVVRIALADGGRRIAGLTVLQSHHHPAFDEPTTGTVVGDALHVIANSHVGRYRPDGSIAPAPDGRPLTPPTIVAVPLSPPRRASTAP